VLTVFICDFLKARTAFVWARLQIRHNSIIWTLSLPELGGKVYSSDQFHFAPHWYAKPGVCTVARFHTIIFLPLFIWSVLAPRGCLSGKRENETRASGRTLPTSLVSSRIVQREPIQIY